MSDRGRETLKAPLPAWREGHDAVDATLADSDPDQLRRALRGLA